MRLEGKVALITGASRGQGAEEAKLFSKEGAAVIATDVLDEDGKKLEAEINRDGGNCLFIHLDVSDPQQWENVISETLKVHKRIDVLVNNAGIAVWGTNDDTTEEIWDNVMDINAKGVFLGPKYVLPEMKSTGADPLLTYRLFPDFGDKRAYNQCITLLKELSDFLQNLLPSNMVSMAFEPTQFIQAQSTHK